MRTRRLLAVLALLALLLPWGRGMAAAAPPVSIELSPDSVQLTPQGTAQVLVVARNDSAAAVRRIVLSSFGGTRLRAPIRNPTLASLPPGGTATWSIDIAADPPPMSDTALVLRLDYRTTGATGRAGVTTATLQVKPPPPRRLDELVKVEVQSSVESVEQRRPGDLFLVIQNLSRSPMQVLDVGPTTPSFVNVTPAEELTFPRQVGAEDLAVLHYTVTTTDKVRPGRQLVLFTVVAQVDDDGVRQQVTLVASHTVNAAVFGESALLGVLAIPSFLVLPGFLMLATFSVMAVDIRGRRQIELLKVASPAFWVFAVALSLLTIPAYPFLTGLAARVNLLPSQRNYLDGYGFADIAIVWFGSILIGLLAFVATDLYSTSRRRRRTLSRKDSLVDVLNKLDRTGRPARLPLYKAKDQNVILLDQHDGTQPADQPVWVAPRAIAEIPAELDAAFTDLLNRGAPKPLADFIKRTGLAYRWQPPRTGPTPERFDELKSLNSEENLIEVRRP
jgi:hypothetical protein